MDVIRDGQGLDWLIDFNPRAFGGSGSFRAAGIDTTEGYLRVIGAALAPHPVARRPSPVCASEVFPTCLEDVIESGSILAHDVGVPAGVVAVSPVAGLAVLALGGVLDGGPLRLVRKEVDGSDRGGPRAGADRPSRRSPTR